MIPRRLTQKEFLAFREQSFDFYSVLPSDLLQLDGPWEEGNLVTIGREILSSEDFRNISSSYLDRFACLLLLNGSNSLSNEVDWYALADRMAIRYSQHFKEDGARSIGMRACRINFFLRDILEHHSVNSSGIISRRLLSANFPWDWQYLEGGELVIDSDKYKNFHYFKAGRDKDCWLTGLPTQINFVRDYEFAVTSCFSDGWFDWRRNQVPIYRAHHAPVVIVFEFEKIRYLLDNKGCLYTVANRRLLLRLPSESVWRARFIDDVLYVFSLAIPYQITVVCMNSLRTSQIDSNPVIIPNDICKISDSFYMIDKMQGKVFSFDLAFRPKGERMTFGRGRFSLYDPIALRAHSNSLWALSWMTNSLTRLQAF